MRQRAKDLYKVICRQLDVSPDFDLSEDAVAFLLGKRDFLWAVLNVQKKDYRNKLIEWFEQGQNLDWLCDDKGASYKAGVKSIAFDMVKIVSVIGHESVA